MTVRMGLFVVEDRFVDIDRNLDGDDFLVNNGEWLRHFNGNVLGLVDNMMLGDDLNSLPNYRSGANNNTLVNNGDFLVDDTIRSSLDMNMAVAVAAVSTVATNDSVAAVSTVATNDSVAAVSTVATNDSVAAVSTVATNDAVAVAISAVGDVAVVVAVVTISAVGDVAVVVAVVNDDWGYCWGGSMNVLWCGCFVMYVSHDFLGRGWGRCVLDNDFSFSTSTR